MAILAIKCYVNELIMPIRSLQINFLTELMYGIFEGLSNLKQLYVWYFLKI